MTVSTAVVGAHQTTFVRAESRRSLEEMVFQAARGALADAGLGIDDVDGIVLATSDQVQGRVIESMVANGAAGGVGKDVTTLASAGEHALVYAHLRLLAGQGRRLLVVTWSKASEGLDPAHAERVAAEPFLLRPLGIDQSVAAGLQASAYVGRWGLDEDGRDRLRAARVPTDVSDPRGTDLVAWPLERVDLPLPVDVACAVVLVSQDAVDGRQDAAWVTGVGWATESYELGDRDLSRFAALETATERAQVGALGPGTVVEVQEISTVGAWAAYEALGLCPAGQGASVTGDPGSCGGPVVNPSAGNLAAHPTAAAGFLRLVAAAQQVRGRAQDAQVQPPPRRAVGAALHGFAGQGAAVMVFESTRRTQR